MAKPKVLILRAPGTNCDEETAYAFQCAGGEAERVHVNQILEQPRLLKSFQIVCIPGGFSYGDDIAAGKILASHIQHRLADSLGQFQESGRLILGICNGFQVLMKTGILLGHTADNQPLATLAWNSSGKFEDRWVSLRTDGPKCVFLNGIETMYLPVAHAEGRFVVRDADTLGTLQRTGELALRYDDPEGSDRVDYPDNPNGSDANVAGICDPTGRVFGLMPHPERFIDPTQHPRWTRSRFMCVGDGLAVFKNAVEHC